MIRFLLALALVAPQSADAGQFLSSIAVATAVTAGASPAPTPAPSGVCDNCNGTGKLGDGTVFVPCPVCGGDGKIEAAAELQQRTATPVVDQKAADGGAVVHCPCGCADCAAHVAGAPCPCKCENCTCPKPPSIAAAKPLPPAGTFDGRLSPNGQWRWSTAKYAWVKVEPKYVTIPATGHWVSQRVCGAGGCQTKRVWVQDSLARKVPVDGTSTPAWPEYPRRSADGSFYRYNGGAPTPEHLARTHGFDLNWLRSLDQQQLNALHADAHRGNVRKDLVVQ